MKTCTKCGIAYPATHQYFNRAKWIKSGLRSDCKTCYAEGKRIAWQEYDGPSTERSRKLKQLAAVGLRECKTCNAVLDLSEHNFCKTSAGWWNSDCRICVRERTVTWANNNEQRAAINAYRNCALRYASKRNRTPRWLNKAQKAEIRMIYEMCKSLRMSGLNYHVDHIIPLVGRTVSGLHVPWNLQLLPGSLNCRKSNKIIESDNFSVDAVTVVRRKLQLQDSQLSGQT